MKNWPWGLVRGGGGEMTEGFRADRAGVGKGKHNSHTPDPKGSVDDGKRRVAVLEVDVSPLRANKGGSLRGEAPKTAGRQTRGQWMTESALQACLELVLVL